jgi:dienelactone hydrolase
VILLTIPLLLAACGPRPGSDPASDGSSPSSTPPDTAPSSDTAPADTAPVDTAHDPGLPSTDFAAPGPHAVTSRAGTLEVPGCSLAYTEFLPDGDDTAPLVVLGHGFQRSQRQVADLARHVAAFGLRVVTPESCHASVFDSDPAQNGRDAAALASALAPGAPHLHAGHSNGGLSALFAAATDPDAVAALALDPVDTDGVVGDALDTLTAPVWALFGEPTSCNDDGGLLTPLRGAGATLHGLAGANHCDFEAPTDALCTAFCGQPTGAKATVQALLAAFAAYSLGVDPTGADWVLPPGDRHQDLLDAGVLVEL